MSYTPPHCGNFFETFKEHNPDSYVIASGGIRHGLDVVNRIKNGAGHVNLCSALLLDGPIVLWRMRDQIKEELNRLNLSQLSELSKSDSQIA